MEIETVLVVVFVDFCRCWCQYVYIMTAADVVINVPIHSGPKGMVGSNALPDLCFARTSLLALILLQHDIDVNSESLPMPIRCSTERLQDTGAYLLGNTSVCMRIVGDKFIR